MEDRGWDGKIYLNYSYIQINMEIELPRADVRYSILKWIEMIFGKYISYTKENKCNEVNGKLVCELLVIFFSLYKPL